MGPRIIQFSGFKVNEELCDEHTMLFQKPSVFRDLDGCRSCTLFICS